MNNILSIIISKISILRNRNKKVVDEELKLSKEGIRYGEFKDFLKDCPEYQIKSGWIATQIRNIFRSFGAEYQQYVFIDNSSSIDKTCFLRKDGDIVLHNKGTYTLPWKSEKKIIYFDIHDMRPLIDHTNEMDWKNPDAVADVVTAITNSKSMAGMNGKEGMNFTLILCVLVVITLLLIGATLYTEMDDHKKVVAMIRVLNNSIQR